MIIELPGTFPFTVEQAAMLSGVSVRTIQRAIKRYHKDPEDRYALRARQSGPRGKVVIEAGDLEQYKQRGFYIAG